jgi:hypothetical protein
MPKSWPHSFSRVVRCRSSSDGSGSPDGWLCRHRMLDAPSRTAGPKTYRGCTSDALTVPTDTSVCMRYRCFVLRSTTQNRSLSSS